MSVNTGGRLRETAETQLVRVYMDFFFLLLGRVTCNRLSSFHIQGAGGRFAKRRMNTVGPKSLRAHFATRKGRVETWASQPDVQQLQWQMPQHGTRHTNPNPIVLSTHSPYIGSPNLGGR